MPLSRAERVGRRRAKLRAGGLRPLQLWVPDTSVPGFAEECLRQARVINEQQTAETVAEDQFWEQVSADAWDDLD